MLDIKKFKTRLETIAAETQAALASAKESTKAVALDQTMVGRLSRMDALQQQEMALAAERRRHTLLDKISSALQRIANDTYGYCTNCDEPIADKRLELDPTILTCIDCAKGAS